MPISEGPQSEPSTPKPTTNEAGLKDLKHPRVLDVKLKVELYQRRERLEDKINSLERQKLTIPESSLVFAELNDRISTLQGELFNIDEMLKGPRDLDDKPSKESAKIRIAVESRREKLTARLQNLQKGMLEIPESSPVHSMMMHEAALIKKELSDIEERLSR